MGLEIVGSRVLSPYFGSSIFVWGSLISVFLGSLSLGYLLGGKLADRYPHFTTLSLLVLAAGLLIWLIPLVSNPIILFLVNLGLGSRPAPLVASLSIFFLPSMLLGTVSPYAVRLRATDIARMGNVSGGLYAISSAGSILGTLLTAFALIPLIGVRIIFLCLGATLLILSGLGSAVLNLKKGQAVMEEECPIQGPLA